MNDCNPTLKSRQYQGGPQIGELLMTIPAKTGGHAIGDAYSGKLLFPARFLMFTQASSVGNAYNPPSLPTATFNVLVHFRPFGFVYNTPAVNLVTNANLPWIQFGGKFPGTWIKFEPGNEIQEFWVDCDGAAANTQLNFIYSNGIDLYVPASPIG